MFCASVGIVTDNEKIWGQFFERAWQKRVVMSNTVVVGSPRRHGGQADEPAPAVMAALGIDAMAMMVPTEA